MQDNSCVHLAKDNIKFLNDSKIKFISWPDKGADFNPIEHCWAKLKDMIW